MTTTKLIFYFLNYLRVNQKHYLCWYNSVLDVCEIFYHRCFIICGLYIHFKVLCMTIANSIFL